MARHLDHRDLDGNAQLVDHAFDDDAGHAAALAVLASEYLDANGASRLGRHAWPPSPGERPLPL